jgi:WD40 repeat protein
MRMALTSSRTDLVRSVAFSPDGSLLAIACASANGSVRVWEVATGRQRMTLAGHSGAVRSVAFSPDGTLLASAGDDRVVRVWEVATGRERAKLTGHSGAVRSVAFSPDGSLLASAGAGGSARLWDAITGKLVAQLLGFEDGGWAVLLPNGSYELVGDPGNRFWWAIKTARFNPGELDPFDTTIRRLAKDATLPPVDE